MGLFERWTYAGDEQGVKIAAHAFGAALAELARGSVTVQQIVNAFALDAQAQTELSAIIQKYNDLPTEVAKAKAMGKFQDVLLLIEAGIYNEAKARTELGF